MVYNDILNMINKDATKLESGGEGLTCCLSIHLVNILPKLIARLNCLVGFFESAQGWEHNLCSLHIHDPQAICTNMQTLHTGIRLHVKRKKYLFYMDLHRSAECCHGDDGDMFSLDQAVCVLA